MSNKNLGNAVKQNISSAMEFIFRFIGENNIDYIR